MRPVLVRPGTRKTVRRVLSVALAGIAVSVLLSMFGGPFIVMQKVVAGLRKQEIHALLALFGTLIAGMWSVCAGLFYLSLLVSA